MLTIGKNLVAFAGKTGVYFRTLTDCLPDGKCDNGDEVLEGKVQDLNFIEEWKDKNAHIECITISMDDMSIAITDSLHGLRMYERKDSVNRGEWNLIFSKECSKRVIKLQFTTDGNYLTYLDKQGDIYAIRMSSCRQQISNAKKIMGHTSFISDFVARVESNQIISCDRDEKIRISNFPDGFQIQGFKLGHTEAVVSLSLLNPHGSLNAMKENGSVSTSTVYLLSISVDGVIILWDLKEVVPGTETEIIKKWNIKDLLPETQGVEVQAMRVLQNEEGLHLAITLGGSTKVLVFNVDYPDLTLKLSKEVEADSDLILVDWASKCTDSKATLIVYTPQLASIRSWQPEQTSLQLGSKNFSDEIENDLKASAEFLKPLFVPMKKRQTTFEDAPPTSFQKIHSKKIKV